MGRPSAADVFVTAAEDIYGLNAAQIAERLAIPAADKYTLYKFSSAGIEGIASPINRPNPGFVGGGLTAGGAREYVIPNMSVPSDALRIVVGP